MNRRQIDRFFRVLSKQIAKPARVILTGASAGSIWGSIRPSLDIDFGISLASANSRQWQAVEVAIQRTVAITGIPANFAEDIDRWGQISLMDYRKRTLPYKRFGKLNVRLLHPAYWSIGKITRYLDPDVQDLAAVLKKQRLNPQTVVAVWARALKKSPRSEALFQFRRQAEHFLRVYGKEIWGKSFDAQHWLGRFYKLAGIKIPDHD